MKWMALLHNLNVEEIIISIIQNIDILRGIRNKINRMVKEQQQSNKS